MEKARMTRIVWCIVGLLCLTGAASAMSSAHYDLDWNVIGGGGGAAGSAHYSLNSTIGQVLGQGTSTSYKLTGGFWSILETIPSISSITPNSGPIKEKIPITIRGANFVSGGLFGVKIGGLPATNIARINATTITAKTPEGTAGAKDVVVTNNDGQTATKVGGFTCVVPPTISIAPPAIPVAVPTISSIMPDSGPTKGNTPITIRGTNFVSGGSFGVKVGGWAATNVTWINATTITAKTPLGSAGARIVVVTNNDGQTATKVGGYTYL
jgi:hypothetical protein